MSLPQGRLTSVSIFGALGLLALLVIVLALWGAPRPQLVRSERGVHRSHRVGTQESTSPVGARQQVDSPALTVAPHRGLKITLIGPDGAGVVGASVSWARPDFTLVASQERTDAAGVTFLSPPTDPVDDLRPIVAKEGYETVILRRSVCRLNTDSGWHEATAVLQPLRLARITCVDVHGQAVAGVDLTLYSPDRADGILRPIAVGRTDHLV